MKFKNYLFTCSILTAIALYSLPSSTLAASAEAKCFYSTNTQVKHVSEDIESKLNEYLQSLSGEFQASIGGGIAIINALNKSFLCVVVTRK